MEELAESVYDTACGLLMESHCVPGVEDAFAVGQPCNAAYQQMLAAYGRLQTRLGTEGEDGDVEQIISSLLKISRILGKRMFCYGVEYGSRGEHP